MAYVFSIIIPHKNLPSLLQRCLDSIPVRDDVQVIIVDDNSDPDKVDFASFPGRERQNTEVIYTKEGKGAGYARNIGIDHALGRWVIFADSDDFFNYCFNDVLDEYASADYDVVYCNASSVDTEMYFNSGRSRLLNDYHNKEDNDPSKEYYFRYVWGEPWGKMIKLSLLKQHCIKCEETRIHNDTQLTYLVGVMATSIHIDRRAIYCVTDRAGSISKQLDKECLFTRLNVFCKKYCELKKYGVEEFEDYFILSPFRVFRANGDVGSLQKCYEIVSTYGIGRNVIDKKLLQIDLEAKREERVNRVRRIKQKVLRLLTGANCFF